MTYQEREAQRKARTASQERGLILWAVVVGQFVQALELVIALLILKAILDAIT